MSAHAVSLLLAIYNPSLEKLYRSLRSVVMQKGVPFQIVICDDGSSQNYEETIKRFMDSLGFQNYIYVRSETNHGTVANLLHGLQYCDGDYIKVLGQGDMLFDDLVLKQMYEFASINKLKAVTGFFQCFSEKNGKPELVSINRMPQNLECFSDKEKAIDQYVVSWDILNAATVLYEKICWQRYLKEINGKIHLCEDHALRLMILDGIRINILKMPVIYYEVAAGVSTGGNNEYRRILNRDREVFFQMAKEREADNSRRFRVFDSRIRVIRDMSKWNILCCLFSDYRILEYWVHCKFFPIKTDVSGQDAFLKRFYS